MAGRTRNPGQSVLARALAILEVFEGGGGAKSLTDISVQTQLAPSTCSRLLRELEEWGALRRDPQGRYQIGMRLWELGQNAGRQLREIARPLLQDVFSLTQETSHLAIREGAEVLYVDRIYGSKRVPQASRVGGRLPIHATAVGKVILAFEPEWVREAILTNTLESRTEFTHVRPTELRRELVRIHERGFATASQEVRLGSASIAVPLVRSDGSVIGGLGIVVGSEHERSMERHLPVLRGVARQIEARTGGIPLAGMRAGRRRQN